MRSQNLLLILLVLFAKSLLAQDSEKGTGLVFLSPEEYKKIPLASTAMLGSLPSSRDLSNWFPTPGFQGEQSSCVAWAVGYGLKSYQEAVERKQSPSQAFVFSPSYIFNQIKISDCRHGGSYIYKALDLLKTQGVPTLSQFSYDEFNCTRQPNSADRQAARPYAIAEWRTVPFDNEADVKSHIATGFPVVIGMMIDDGFKAIRGDQIYYGPSGQEGGGHAMVVTGYDDSRGAFKVMNSWGTGWGNGGFGWISYSAFKRRVKEAYSAQDIVINDPNNNTSNVNPDPVPIPNVPISIPTANAYATIQAPIITHNISVTTPTGNFPGMMITIPWVAYNSLGASAQVVVRFYQANGQPLMANAMEKNYRDINGLVAAGTTPFQVIYNPSTAQTPVYIPYFALNFAPSNGVNQYSVNAVSTIYINQFEKAKSFMTPMLIRY